MLLQKIWKLAKEARDQGKEEVANAYFIAALYVEDYLTEQAEKRRLEEKERCENATLLAQAIIKAFEDLDYEGIID